MYKLNVVFMLLFSASASAHFPLMHCWFESENVACEAGYSDGSKAINYEVKLYDYDDNLLAKKNTDKRSVAEFVKPATDFYLVFDSGHENPVEVDVVEISYK
jgi:heme-binding NEAT domain protein